MKSKLKFLTHAKYSYKKKDKTTYTKPPAFKVHLLEQESIRTLYRNRLKVKLTPLSGNIDTDWLKIKETTKAAEEIIGYKKWINWKWFRTWNVEIQGAIEEKNTSYRKYLQNKTLDFYLEYKRHRAIVRKVTQRQRRDDWDKFVKTLERDITGTQRDITGTQRGGFKIFKQLQLQDRDKLKIDPIRKTEWKEYCGETLE